MSKKVLMISQHRDLPGYAAYREAATALNVKYGYPIINQPGSTTVAEGEWPYDRIVIIEFPDRASAEAFYKSEEYKSVKALRADAPAMTVLITDCID